MKLTVEGEENLVTGIHPLNTMYVYMKVHIALSRVSIYLKVLVDNKIGELTINDPRI